MWLTFTPQLNPSVLGDPAKIALELLKRLPIGAQALGAKSVNTWTFNL